MSSIPYTSLGVNLGGVEIFHFEDYVYLMAPALKGGVLLDDFGVPIIDKTGKVTFVPKIIGNIEACEAEFGLATAGSPMSIYARWILDRVKVPLVCRRVVGDDLASAHLTLYDKNNIPVLWLESKSKTELANKIMLDVSPSSLSEFFFKTPNAEFYPEKNILHIETDYVNSEKLTFDGYCGDIPFRSVTVAHAGQHDYDFFDFNFLIAEDENKQYSRVADNTPAKNLQANQVSFYAATGELVFGSPPEVGVFSLVIHGRDAFNNAIQLFLSPDGISKTYKIIFPPGSISFNALFVDGYGTENIANFNYIARLSSLKDAPSQEIFIECVDGTITGTTKLIVSAIVNGDTVVEEFDDLISYQDLITRVNNITTGSKFVIGEIWQKEDNASPVPKTTKTSLGAIGFQATFYLDGYTETYDNLRDVSELQFNLNYKSLLARAAVLNQAYASMPKTGSVGLRLRNGSSGLNPTTINYLDALADAEKMSYITIIIAPGVSDPNFHALMKNHCHEMFKRGKYRTTIVGGDLNETPDKKKSRGLALSHERVSVIGDGLKLVSPLTGEAEMFSPAICTAAFVAQILSEYYYISQTYKIMGSAKGVEHNYDDAQLEDLHNGRLVLFQKSKFGIQIVDGITTSPINAYEDIHMVRIFDAISRNVKQIMENKIGQSNLPVTWAYITSIVKRMLDLMKDADAIQDYRFITEVRPQDIIDKRYKFRIGVVPVFPIKYIEGFIDIFPPYAVET